MAAATLCNSVNALAALRELLVASRLPVNFADTPHTTQIDTMQSKVDAPGDSEYAGPMPVAAMLRNVHKATREALAAPIPRHVQTPCFCCIPHQSTGRATATSEVVATAKAFTQAQAAVSDSQDGYLMLQRLRMPAGRHRRGGVKALESAM
jgi:hypothetical protein